MSISNHLKGILITTLGVIILSPDALLIRLLNTDTWTAVFWRGLAFSTGILILMLLMYRRDVIQVFRNIGKAGMVIGVIFGISSFFFTTSVQNTSIANTLVIISTSPLFAALFSWIYLVEKVPLRTWLAMLVIFTAIAMIMWNSAGTSSIWGDLAALGTAVFMAISFTFTRKHKETNMVPAMFISGLVSASLAALIIKQTTNSFYLSDAAIPYLILGGIVVTLAFALITLGPRYIPAPEVSLIMPLETVLGTYLGWIFINEKPSSLTIIGGIIVILTLMIHAWLSLKHAENRYKVGN